MSQPNSTSAIANGTPDGDKNGPPEKRVAYEEMTSKDYYFDSYAHFGIHEVS